MNTIRSKISTSRHLLTQTDGVMDNVTANKVWAVTAWVVSQVTHGGVEIELSIYLEMEKEK